MELLKRDTTYKTVNIVSSSNEWNITDFLNSPLHKELAAQWLFWKTLSDYEDRDIECLRIRLNMIEAYMDLDWLEKELPYLIDLYNDGKALLKIQEEG